MIPSRGIGRGGGRLSAGLAWSVLLVACAAPERTPTEHRPAPNALGPYSGAVVAGEFVFVAGKVGRDRVDFASEVRSAIDAVAAELEAVGLTLADVVSSTIYLTDIERYAEVNAIYAERFPAPYPARTCIAVQALPGGAQVEVQCIARRR